MQECDRIELLKLTETNLATQYKELALLRAEVAKLLHPLSYSVKRHPEPPPLRHEELPPPSGL